MKRGSMVAVAVAIALFQSPAVAQSHPTLHLTNRWKECSFQLDPALTQTAWRQFTGEAALVAYFRPLAGAEPMGRGKFEINLMQYTTGIDDHDAAWNDTFVHPDSTHWLFEGSGLSFPGVTARLGITDRTDVGVYFTKNPNANYGFFGAQVQRNVLAGATGNWSTSARLGYSQLFGPEDVTLAIIGLDVVGGRKFQLNRWASVSPYAGVSTFISNAHERTNAVSLDDEHVIGAQAMVGAALQVSVARLAAEYNISKVNSLSLRVGFGR